MVDYIDNIGAHQLKTEPIVSCRSDRVSPAAAPTRPSMHGMCGGRARWEVANYLRRSFMSIRDQVKEFHAAMCVPTAASATIPPDERVRLRARLITEEYLETMLAMFVKIGALGVATGLLQAVANE